MAKFNGSKDSRRINVNQDENLKLQQLLKANAYKSGIKRLRRRLSPVQRLFSYFTQAKLVDDISNFVSATLARPYPLLSASIVAFLGTSVTVYFAKHYGYSYNFFLIIYFFIVGYLLELLIEFIIKLLIKSK